MQNNAVHTIDLQCTFHFQVLRRFSYISPSPPCAANVIGDEGARHLAEALEQNDTVHTINLQCTFYVRVVYRFLCVAHLPCVDNKIGAEGARSLADSLKQNNTLHSIDLQCTYTFELCIVSRTSVSHSRTCLVQRTAFAVREHGTWRRHSNRTIRCTL